MRALGSLLLLLVPAGLIAQTAPAGSIQAVGNASLSVTPDQAQLTVGVITNGATAQDAAQQNATQTTNMINAVKGVLGSSGTIETVGYSLYPRYGNSVSGSPPIIGYSASNTLSVTTTDLSLPGRIIDAANQAGGNNVSGISFGLQNPDPAKQQALTAASKQALAHAAAIASGLGAHAGGVISAVEGATYSPAPLVAGVAGGGATVTPVQTGTVTVTAVVTVTVQLTQ